MKPIKDINDEIMKDSSMQALNRDDPTEFESSMRQIYHAHGYDPEGKALPIAQQLFGKASRATGISESNIQSMAATPLPAIGTIVGAQAGIGGAAFGGYAGSKANELLGITGPMSTEDSIMALGSGLLPTGVSKTGQALAKSSRGWPGAPAGLHELAGETTEKAFNMARVSKTQVDAARSALIEVPDLKIPTPKLRALLDNEMKSAFNKSASLGDPAELEGYAKQVMNARNAVHTGPGQTHKDQMSFKDLMTTHQGLVDMKTEGSGAVWGKASGVIIEDLEAMINDPKITSMTRKKAEFALGKFRNVVNLDRQYKANEALDNVMKKVFQPVSGNEDLHAFNKKEFIKELQNNKVLTEAYSKDDLANMKDAVEHIGYLGSVSKMTIGHGSMDFVGRSTAPALIGYQIGSQYGSGQMGMMGGFAAAVALSSAISTQTGRNVVKYLAKQGRGKIDALELRDTMGKLLAATTSGINANIRAPSEGAVNAFENQQ